MSRNETALPRETMSIDEAAAELGFHRETVRRYIAEGRIRGYRVGPRAIRVHAADVEALLRPIPAADAG